MSGHSKWSTIKRQKGAADARRGAVFTKLGNQIAIATREGGSGDVESNFKLRLAVEKARQANMPKENIQRSIDRGLGKGEAAVLETAIYEGFGPGGVAVVVETITDNKTRTASDLRNIFEKAGGNLGSVGSVSYMFTRVGEIEIAKDNLNLDQVTEKALEADAEDVEENEESFSVFTKPEELHKVQGKLAPQGVAVKEASLVFRPNRETMVVVGEDKREAVEKFLEIVSELDDVQEVYINA